MVVRQTCHPFTRFSAPALDTLHETDVPYGDNWDDADEVLHWTESADQKRPWRTRIRSHIADQVAKLKSNARILELGCGPGLLAECILQRCPDLERYTLLDFSEAMLTLSKRRLGSYSAAAFVQASFKSGDWTCEVDGPFDAVVSMQAVHELRHKRHAVALYEQTRRVLVTPGTLLLCDHTPFDDSLKSATLYMTEDEQLRALADAGFSNVQVSLSLNGLVLYQADANA